MTQSNLRERLALRIEAHRRYHDTGMCYGDSHASFEFEIDRLERMLAAEIRKTTTEKRPWCLGSSVYADENDATPVAIAVSPEVAEQIAAGLDLVTNNRIGELVDAVNAHLIALRQFHEIAGIHNSAAILGIATAATLIACDGPRKSLKEAKARLGAILKAHTTPEATPKEVAGVVTFSYDAPTGPGTGRPHQRPAEGDTCRRPDGACDGSCETQTEGAAR